MSVVDAETEGLCVINKGMCPWTGQSVQVVDCLMDAETDGCIVYDWVKGCVHGQDSVCVCV